MTSHYQSRQRGITLVELLIVITIVGILASIMIPSYQESVRRAHRADGQAVVLELSQFMERFYTENGRFDVARDGTTIEDTLANSALLRAPKSGGTVYYVMTLENVGSQTYEINANPVNAQNGDKCGILTYDQSGVRNVKGGTANVENCW